MRTPFEEAQQGRGRKGLARGAVVAALVLIPLTASALNRDRLCKAIGDTPNIALQPRDRAYFEDECVCYGGTCAHKDTAKGAAIKRLIRAEQERQAKLEAQRKAEKEGERKRQAKLEAQRKAEEKAARKSWETCMAEAQKRLKAAGQELARALAERTEAYTAYESVPPVDERSGRSFEVWYQERTAAVGRTAKADRKYVEASDRVKEAQEALEAVCGMEP